MQNTQQDVIWRLAYTNIEPPEKSSGMTIEDFTLGKFDEECLGDTPPEPDWSDWFPPPPRLTEWELCELTDWVEIEASKKNLIPDPDTYPLTDYFDAKETYGKTIDPTQYPCTACTYSGAGCGISKLLQCPLSCPLVGTLRG